MPTNALTPAITTINPANEQIIKRYDYMSEAQITQAIDGSKNAWQNWRNTAIETRAGKLRNLSSELHKRKASLADLMSLEMGKPTAQAIAEIEKCAAACEYYADNAATLLEDKIIRKNGTISRITHQPLGLILAIMPWNFPLWQVIRCAAPIVTAGNGLLLKHAENVTGCALEIESLFEEAGFPKGLVKTLIVPEAQTEAIIANSDVQGVALTGSTRAGSAVATLAGKYIKKTVLELGGSDPYIILQDADIAKAAKACAASRLQNAGQSCIAAKRFIVMEDVYALFLNALKTEFETYKMGDPKDPKSNIGPLARLDLRDQLHEQVTRSVALGADVILGGHIPPHEGAWYTPTILTNITPDMPAYKEELFGPVATIIKVKSTQDAVNIANDTPYGLGAAIFTKDISHGEQLAQNHLECGNVTINDFVKSTPYLPFGGIKNSGFGRELSSYGLHEFTNIKVITQSE